MCAAIVGPMVNPPPRDRLRRESARALQTAALALVERRGFSAVTVDDITAEAGMSRRTFFNYFSTKAAALFDPDPDDADRLAALLAEVETAPSLWPALRYVCVGFVVGHEQVLAVRRRLVDQDPELDQYHRAAHHHVEVALEEWAARHCGDDPYRAALAAHAAAAVLITAFIAWQPDQDPAMLVELVDRGFVLIADTFET